MKIEQRATGAFVIIHGGLEISQDFLTEDAAWSWADSEIDDQVFDGPNTFSDPLAYRPTSAAPKAKII